MKKKLLLGCLAVLLSAAASFAQERPNRLVFHLKSGEVLAVPLAKADSVTFDRTSAAGDIRVDVTLLKRRVPTSPSMCGVRRDAPIMPM